MPPLAGEMPKAKGPQQRYETDRLGSSWISGILRRNVFFQTEVAKSYLNRPEAGPHRTQRIHGPMVAIDVDHLRLSERPPANRKWYRIFFVGFVTRAP